MMSFSAVLVAPVVFFLFSSFSSAEQCSLTPPVRSPYWHNYCQIEGRLAPYGSDGSASRTASVEECALLCSRHEGLGDHDDEAIRSCRSFSYDTKNRFCSLSDFEIEFLSDEIVRDNHTATYFYDFLICFDCPDPCKHQPYGQQLVDNGDFENGLLGPWESSRGRIVRTGHLSLHAWQCADRLPKHGFPYPCKLQQVFNVCKNQTYLIQFDYKIPHSKHGAHKNLTLGSSFAYYLQIPSVAGDWKTAQLFTKYDSASAYSSEPNTLTFYSDDDSSNFLIDNVHVSRAPVDTFVPAVSESLENGGFETGSLSPWQFTPINNVSATIYQPGLSGSKYALKIEGDSDFNLNFVTQTFNTTPGAMYRFQFDFNAPRANQDSMTMMWQSGDFSLYIKVPEVYPKHVVEYFIAYATQSTIGISLDFSFYYTLFDNISIKELRRPVS